MIGTLLKMLAYTQVPKTTFATRHPVRAAQVVKTPFDFRTAYAPRISAVLTALVVIPLAYRVGKRVGAGALIGRSGTGTVRLPTAPRGSSVPGGVPVAGGSL